MGSPNDRPKMEPAAETLCGVRHRGRRPGDVGAPHAGQGWPSSSVPPARRLRRGHRRAGMAAHLAGAAAANTTLPVIGVPLSGGALNGVDALYATVQMPKGIPVATVAVDGAINAALLVVQMLAISDADLEAKLVADREAACLASVDGVLAPAGEAARGVARPFGTGTLLVRTGSASGRRLESARRLAGALGSPWRRPWPAAFSPLLGLLLAVRPAAACGGHRGLTGCCARPRRSARSPRRTAASWGRRSTPGSGCSTGGWHVRQ